MIEAQFEVGSRIDDSVPVVGQFELETELVLQAELERVQNALNERRLSILLKLSKGGTIAPGVLTAQIVNAALQISTSH